MNSQDPPAMVRANFRRSVSDGNYGTEGAEVTLEIPVDYHFETLESVDHIAQELLKTARRLVTEELLNSPAPAVRRTLQMQLQAMHASPTAMSVPPDDEDIPL